jgi:hypothetical protein
MAAPEAAIIGLAASVCTCGMVHVAVTVTESAEFLDEDQRAAERSEARAKLAKGANFSDAPMAGYAGDDSVADVKPTSEWTAAARKTDGTVTGKVADDAAKGDESAS